MDEPRGSGREVAFVVREREVGYWVTGASARELSEAMRFNGPRRPHGSSGVAGRAWAGYTDWRVEWTGDTVVVDVSMHLPRWLEPSRPPPELVRRWETFVAELRAHERGHRDLAIDAGKAVLSIVRRADPTASTEAAREIERALEKAREAERAYDRDTLHGASPDRAAPTIHPEDAISR